MGGNMQKMMKQVQKMQAEVVRIQEELANRRVEASSGGGMVRAVATCQQELVEIHIDPKVVDPDDIEMLEDLVLAACREALRKAQEVASNELARVTGGLSIPGMGL